MPDFLRFPWRYRFPWLAGVALVMWLVAKYGQGGSLSPYLGPAVLMGAVVFNVWCRKMVKRDAVIAEENRQINERRAILHAQLDSERGAQGRR